MCEKISLDISCLTLWWSKGLLIFSIIISNLEITTSWKMIFNAALALHVPVTDLPDQNCHFPTIKKQCGFFLEKLSFMTAGSFSFQRNSIKHYTGGSDENHSSSDPHPFEYKILPYNISTCNISLRSSLSLGRVLIAHNIIFKSASIAALYQFPILCDIEL